VTTSSNRLNDAYKEAGVDIDLATTLLDRVKRKLGSTRRPEMLAPIGGFGGLFQIDLSKYREPVLVASVDGVGTKLMIACMMNKHDTVGMDIVNHCINDIAVQGAEPVYFMDYIGIGKLRSPLYEDVLSGIADACKASNVAVLGGETAEMPGMYGNDYDLVGCITGLVEKSKIITGEHIKPGHKVIGLGSNGLHTNGFSLARKALFEKGGYQVRDVIPALGTTECVGEVLLKPHLSYWPAIKTALDSGFPLHGMAHITGGGLYDNIPRVLPENVNCVIDVDIMPPPPIFKLIQEKGEVDPAGMYRFFNMGIGMIWIVPATHAEQGVQICRQAGFRAEIIGDITPGDQSTILPKFA
jgi:phosphoribosylformylglycinamidine cyclo-ligase